MFYRPAIGNSEDNLLAPGSCSSALCQEPIKRRIEENKSIAVRNFRSVFKSVDTCSQQLFKVSSSSNLMHQVSSLYTEM